MRLASGSVTFIEPEELRIVRRGNPVEMEELGEDYSITEEEFIPPVEEFPAPTEEPMAAPVDPAEVSESYREHLDLVTSPEFQEAPPEEKAAMLTVADAVERATEGVVKEESKEALKEMPTPTSEMVINPNYGRDDESWPWA